MRRKVENSGLIEDAPNMAISRDGAWSQRVLAEIVAFLLNMGSFLQSDTITRLAEALKVVRDAEAVPFHNCPTYENAASRYPILCETCMNQLVAVTPQKLVLIMRDERSDCRYAVAMYSYAFAVEKFGKPNTLAGAEELLDSLNCEEDVAALIAILTERQKGETAS